MIFNMLGGGSSPLSFRISKYEYEEDLPEVAKDNDIAVITSTDISCWKICTTTPTEPTEGLLWIKSSNAGTVGLNALKKNAINVYLLSAHQYANGKWKNVTAYIGVSNAWVQFSTGGRIYLYKAGWSESETKAKWTTSTRWKFINAVTPTMEVYGDRLRAYISDTEMNYESGILETKDGVDCTTVNTLTFDVKTVSISGSDGFIRLGITNNLTGTVTPLAQVNASVGVHSIDISSLTGVHDIIAMLSTATGAPHYAILDLNAVYVE